MAQAEKAVRREEMWPLMVSVSQAIYPVTRAAVEPVFEAQFPERSHFNPVRMAREADPAPFGPEDVLARFPYNNPARLRQTFAGAAAAGYLEAAGEERYRIGEQGKAAVDRLNDTFYRRLSEIPALADAEMATLIELLQRVVQATLAAPAPRKLGLKASHGSAEPRAYAPLAQVDLALDDLNAFRDDAHIAAWEGEGVSARDWETLTMVWRDEAHTAAELAEKLPFRGYEAAAYERSLAELAARGWLEAEGEGYRISEAGRARREAVEAQTDAIFYAPWAVLDEREVAQLHSLLERLHAQLVALARAEAVAE